MHFQYYKQLNSSVGRVFAWHTRRPEFNPSNIYMGCVYRQMPVTSALRRENRRTKNCLRISSKIKTFQGSFLSRESTKQELTRFTRLHPARQSKTRSNEDSGPAQLPERALDQPRHLERALPNLWSCLQAVQSTPGSQGHELSPMLGRAWVIQLSLRHSCSCKQPSIFLQVTPRKLIGSPSWALVVSVLWSILSSLRGVSR